MKLVGGIGTVAVALALSAPAASAATWTVAAGGGACGGTDTTCETIQDASDAASASDTIQLTSPGLYAGATFNDADLTIQGVGNGYAVILDTLNFNTSATLQRVIVSATSNDTPAVHVATGPHTVKIQSSILSGSGTGAGIDIDALATVEGRHVTVADAGASPPTETAVGANVSFTDSIVLGGGSFAGNNDTDNSPAHRAALFAAPDQDFYFLRFGSPAIGAGGSQQGGETTTDVEGETRPGSGWDRGADEFVNHAPAAPGLVADRTVAAPGQSVLFGAVAGPQPDADRGDGVARYRFDFGDGSGVLDTASASVSHSFAAPGRYAVTARTVDFPGAESIPSNTVTITVAVGLPGGGPRGPDTSPPRLAITSPRRGQSIRIPRRGRTPSLRGTTSDDSGVRRVELALVRRQGRSCRSYNGRRAFLRRGCGNPLWFRAVIDDFAWRFVFPRSVRPAAGSYTLLARATDVLGHTTRVSAAARTSISFRYRR
jgi:PKD domain